MVDTGALRLTSGDEELNGLVPISTASSLPGRNSGRGPANAERRVLLRRSGAFSNAILRAPPFVHQGGAMHTALNRNTDTRHGSA
ncbi:MAG: hypothetical protein ACXIVD_10265 [Salinarimonas sp.]